MAEGIGFSAVKVDDHVADASFDDICITLQGWSTKWRNFGLKQTCNEGVRIVSLQNRRSVS